MKNPILQTIASVWMMIATAFATVAAAVTFFHMTCLLIEIWPITLFLIGTILFVSMTAWSADYLSKL